MLRCGRRSCQAHQRQNEDPREFTDITYDERIVDAACMHLVMHPEKLDVLLLPNLYGDIVSDLVRGAGRRARRRAGGEPRDRDRRCSRRCTAARPTSPIKNLANPTALLLSGLMMLDHIGERDARRAHPRGARPRAAARARSGRAISAARASHHGVHRRDLPGDRASDAVVRRRAARHSSDIVRT